MPNYETLANKARTVAVSMLANDNDYADVMVEEDIVQDALERYEKALQKGTVPRNPEALITVITRNLVKDRWRRVAGRAFVNLEPDHMVSDDFEDRVIAAVMVDELLRCLTDRQRDIVILYGLQDWMAKELVPEYGNSAGAVKAVYFRSMQKMRKRLFNEEIDNDA